MLNYTDTQNSVGTHTGVHDKTRIAKSSGQAAGVMDIVRRYRFLVLVCAVLGGLGAFAFLKLVPKSFISIAQVYVDPRGLQMLDNELTPKGQDSSNTVTMVESQVRVITSQSVMQRVVEKEQLHLDPEFSGVKPSWLDTVQGKRPQIVAGKDHITTAMYALIDKVNVRRPERTFIIDITTKAQTAEKAARLANALADTYLEIQTQNRAEIAQKATRLLTGRLDELRETVRMAEDRVEAYKTQNNLVGTRAQLVSEQQLSEINLQLTTAQARTSEAKARFDQVERARSTPNQLGALSEAISSPTISALRNQASEANRKLAEFQSDLGDRHPVVRNVRAQANDIRRAIDEELARIVHSVRNDLERAKAGEQAILAHLNTLKTQAVDRSQAFVKLRELEREVETSRNLYQSFLTRAREVGELERLDTSNAHIITRATAPIDRSFPPSGAMVLLAGVLAGLALGMGLAFALDALNFVLPSIVRPHLTQNAGVASASMSAPRARTQRLMPDTEGVSAQQTAWLAALSDKAGTTAPKADAGREPLSKPALAQPFNVPTSPAQSLPPLAAVTSLWPNAAHITPEQETPVADLIGRIGAQLTQASPPVLPITESEPAVSAESAEIEVTAISTVRAEIEEPVLTESALVSPDVRMLAVLPDSAPRQEMGQQNPHALDLTALGLPSFRKTDGANDFSKAAFAVFAEVLAAKAAGAARQTIAVVGAQGSARTTLAVNLALAAAYQGHKVMLADIDPRQTLSHVIRAACASIPERLKRFLDQPWHSSANQVVLIISAVHRPVFEEEAVLANVAHTSPAYDLVVLDLPIDANAQSLSLADHILLAVPSTQSHETAALLSALGTHADKVLGAVVIEAAHAALRHDIETTL